MTAGMPVRAFALAFACILLAAMAKALRTGSTRLVDHGANRRDEPFRFWTVIAVSAVAGVLLALAAVFAPGPGAFRQPVEPRVVRQLARLGPGAERPLRA